MSIDPKTITVFLDASPSGRRRAAHAAKLAKRWQAHLVGVHVVFKGASLHPSMAHARGEKAMAGVIAHEKRLDDACECVTAELDEYYRDLCAETAVSAEFRPIAKSKTEDAAITNSLHSDLLVVGQPQPNGLPDYVSAERILGASGVPLLIIPNAWEGDTIGERIMIGWNASPGARRAVSDAMCLLVKASAVKALIVDPEACKWLGRKFGCDIGEHLARHGADVDVELVASRGRPVPEVILGKAKEFGADLLVVGAKNPAQLQEVLFGSAARSLLAKMPVPVLMSR